MNTLLWGIGVAIAIIGIIALCYTILHYRNKPSKDTDDSEQISRTRQTSLTTYWIFLGAILLLLWLLYHNLNISTFIVIVLLCLVAFQVFLKSRSDLQRESSSGIESIVKTLIFFLSVAAIVFFFFGERWLVYPTLSDRFDIQTGIPNYMVYEVDVENVENAVKPGWDGNKLLRPDDCRPDGVDHKGFNYLQSETCYSPLDNTEKMRPVSSDDEVIIPSLWPVSDNDTTSTKEIVETASRTQRECREKMDPMYRCKTVSLKAGQSTIMSKAVGMCPTYRKFDDMTVIEETDTYTIILYGDILIVKEDDEDIKFTAVETDLEFDVIQIYEGESYGSATCSSTVL